jgi:RNA polymerase sigma-70 factor (ECF subfamily)
MPSPPAFDDDRALFDRIRSGDDEAFERLYRRYYVPLCEFVQLYVGPTTAEDIVQALFAKIWSRRRALPEASNVRAYLFGAGRNRAINMKRAQSTEDRVHGQLKTQQETPAHGPPGTDLEVWSTIRRVLCQLPQDRQLAVMLRLVLGMSHEEIAFVLSTSVKRSQVFLAHARQLLRLEESHA